MKQLLSRIIPHPAWRGEALSQQYFHKEVLDFLTERIRRSEVGHSGELVVAIEAVMPDHEPDSRCRALEVFGRLGVWDTPLNSGVLLYLALDQRRIEIVADRGINATEHVWQDICAKLQVAFGRNQYSEGLLQAVDDIEAVLREQAPPLVPTPSAQASTNHLPDAPVFL